MKCVKVRALFAKNKVRFARAEQLCTIVYSTRLGPENLCIQSQLTPKFEM